MLIPLMLAILAQSPATSQAVEPVPPLSLQGKTHHVQGIDTDGATLWVTSVDRSVRKGYLMAFSVADGHLLRSLEVQDGDRYHPGGLSVDATSVWLPVAEYKAKSSSFIQKRNKKTFELEFQFAVEDHIGCIAVTPDWIIGGNWDSREFYVWDHKGTLLRKVTSETGNAYQDIKFVSGAVVGSGTLTGRQGAVDWLDPKTFRLSRRLPVGNTPEGQPFTREGMTIYQNRIWFLPEDDDSRLFVFPLDTSLVH
ncbi:MAG: hypothetical protein JWN34_1932 [Bryobacterales bacterium]|nr:hypothetical protein [Bryobacterales bacterium]